jgi:hypothetical protein
MKGVLEKKHSVAAVIMLSLGSLVAPRVNVPRQAVLTCVCRKNLNICAAIVASPASRTRGQPCLRTAIVIDSGVHCCSPDHP